jgi:polysaccharide biosynthesis protein VpsM
MTALSVATGISSEAPPPDERMEEASPAGGVARLAAEVSQIANSTSLSRAKKEKRISTAVRVAVVVATTYKRDPREILRTAIELTEAAAQAAPHYADVIASSVSLAAPVVRIETSAGQIRAAAFAAARSPRTQHLVKARASKPTPPVQTESDAPAPRDPLGATPRLATGATHQPDFSANEMYPTPNPTASSSAPKLSLGDNASIALTASVGVRHDDNVFLSDTAKVGDTIYSFTPGIEFRFGQNSLAHGGLNYQHAFSRYAQHTSPSVRLGSGSADFGYDNGVVAALGSATYQQLNQNSTGSAGPGGTTAYRRDISGYDAGLEMHLSAKTSVKAGAQINRTKYKSAGLIGSENTSWPLNFYYQTTPKLDLSTGVTFSQVKPDSVGPRGRDTFYNVGMRGEITPKLSGNFSAGYRVRKVDTRPNENLVGFNGSFDYELTPKTSLSLAASRDFSVGVQGESLKSGSYSLQLSSTPSQQWQFSSGLTYRTDDYGAAVFDPRNTTPANVRKDNYWVGSFAATYVFSSWLSFTADETYRTNRSSIEAVQFTNNIISLSLNLRY